MVRAKAIHVGDGTLVENLRSRVRSISLVLDLTRPRGWLLSWEPYIDDTCDPKAGCAAYGLLKPKCKTGD